MVNRVLSFISKMTVDEFEAEVAMLEQAQFFKVPSDVNVDPYGLPRFNIAFDECCRIQGRISSQAEYANYYITYAEDYLKENRLSVYGFNNKGRREITRVKYIPIITLVLGILGEFFFMAHSTPREAIINGIIAALSANGLFDVTKSIHGANQTAPTQQ